ncbi:Transposase IS4 [Popillia japonica]|uniref:Transposase IS4 n=1 Tax=Popillia japonica TaxID=7064 RepID=A0AAW1JG76_POPJA
MISLIHLKWRESFSISYFKKNKKWPKVILDDIIKDSYFGSCLLKGQEIDITQILDTVGTWQDDSTSMRNFEFNETNEMLVDLPPNTEPYEYFRLLVDDDFLNNVVKESNEYAVEMFLKKGGSERARISLWKDLTREELLKFIGLIYHMGTIKLNRLQDYWKTHRLFNLKCFAEQMGRDRFLGILRCLHFVRNPRPNEPTPADRLFKIRPVINYFNDKMRKIYYPGKYLSLDESSMLWRGRLIFRQYISNKRHRYGLKLYMLTEPNGLILNFSVYTGQLDDLRGKGHTQKVVRHLMNNNLNKGHSLFMDNYYNGCELARTLLNNKTHCTGTLQSNRKGVPKEVVGTKLRIGETTAKYLDGIMVGRWRDKREVTYISTQFRNDMVEVSNRRRIVIAKPLPIMNTTKTWEA